MLVMQSTPSATILIPTGDDHPVRADLYLPERAAGICVLCPGFKGYKTWGFIPHIARNLCEAGLAAAAIDFSFNGTIASNPEVRGDHEEPAELYCDPDLFRRNTITREVSDLAFVLRHIIDDGLGGRVDGTLPIGLFGHSRAGVAAVLNALDCTQVKAVASWGTPVDPDIFNEEQKRKWRESGALEFTDSETGTVLAVNSAYLGDLAENRERFDLSRAVARLETPLLIVNGTADVPVPPSEAIQLYRARSRKNKTRLALIRAGHTFGAGSAVTAPTNALIRATEVTVEWFLRNLIQGD
jgi:dienelactone hydrolase